MWVSWRVSRRIYSSASCSTLDQEETCTFSFCLPLLTRFFLLLTQEKNRSTGARLRQIKDFAQSTTIQIHRWVRFPIPFWLKTSTFHAIQGLHKHQAERRFLRKLHLKPGARLYIGSNALKSTLEN